MLNPPLTDTLTYSGITPHQAYSWHLSRHVRTCPRIPCKTHCTAHITKSRVIWAAGKTLTFFTSSTFFSLSLSSSSLLNRRTSEWFFGLRATLLKWCCSTELKITSRERGRIPGSEGVPVTVYVLPDVKNEK